MAQFRIQKSHLYLGISIAIAGLHTNAYAGSFVDDSFTNAEKAARGTTQHGNVNGEKAADTLDTADTIKTTADYVGLGATTATIGTELYDWMSSSDQKKMQDLDAQYKKAIAEGNGKLAEQVLAQMTELKNQKRTAAKSQADTQSSLGTIQTVAGVANLGAGAASLTAGYMGYGAASDLKKGKCADHFKVGATGVPDPKAQEAYDACLKSEKHTDTAVKTTKSAASTALIYGAGEVVVGIGSLYLASKHKQNAKDMQSLSDDPTAGMDTSGEAAYYDRVALEKCGAGATYDLLPESLPSSSSTTVNTSGRGVYDPTVVSSNQSQYPDIFARVVCHPVITYTTDAGTSTSTSTSTSLKCTTDALLCADGSYVTRDPALGCEFTACYASPTIPTTPVLGTTTTPRALSASTSVSGASRMPSSDTAVPMALPQNSLAPKMDDVGAEVERDNSKILKNGF